jgi:hypothetical protein
MKLSPGWRFLLPLFLFVFYAGSAFAEFTKHYPAASFLNAAQVYHVTKDSKGYLWFSTDNGVKRYDGKKMLHFTTMQGLPDNTVFNIYEDKQGRIWLYTYNGQYCFIKDGQVHHAGNTAFLKQLPRGNAYINYIAETDSAEMYVGFYSGDILRIQDTAASWVYRNALVKEYVSVITTDRNQVRAYFKCGYMNIVQGRVTPKIAMEEGNLFCNDGYRVAATKSGIRIYKNEHFIGAINKERFTISTIIYAYFSPSGLLFCCTSHGLEVVDLQQLSSQLLFQDIKITSCAEDIAGNYWVTTYDNGVYLLHHELDAIKRLPVSGKIQKVWAQDGTVYFTADKVLYGLADTVVPATARTVIAPFEAYYNLLYANDKCCFYLNAWKETLQERNEDITTDQLGNWTKKIYSRYDSLFFAYGSTATSFFAKRKGEWKIQRSRSFSEKIKTATQDPLSKEVFFICGSQLYQCDFKRKVSHCILQDSLMANVREIYAFDNTIIATTNTQQIYRICLNARGPVLAVLRAPFIIHEMAFIRKQVYLVRANGRDYITSAGKDGYTFQPLLYPFLSSGYEHIYPYKNYFIIKTEDGLYSFADSLVNKKYAPSKLFFNGLTINGNYYNDTNITIKNTTRLGIHITPGLLSFGSNDRTIQYRIIDERPSPWYHTASEDVNLILERPGNYIIEIGPAMQYAGAAPIRIHINALPPFTRTIGFFLLLGTGILLLGAVAVSAVMKRRRQRFERELNYLKLEHKSINALLNPHFIFNALNNIQSLIYHAKQEEAAAYMATMSQLIRQNIENLQYTLISMDNELILLENYIALQNLRFGDNIVLEIDDRTGNIPGIWLPPLLLHTFVENAIVHGYKERAKKFLVTITIEPALNNYVAITVTDNGIGLQAASAKVFKTQKTSMGIAFNQKRLSRISEYYKVEQSITLKDRAAGGLQGTEVLIVLYARLDQLLQGNMPVH